MSRKVFMTAIVAGVTLTGVSAPVTPVVGGTTNVGDIRISASLSMTFDTVPAGTAIPNGGTYTEVGMIVTSHSDFSIIGTPLPGPPTNNLYFHGTNQYVEFRMADGSKFNLNSFDFITNGFTTMRSLETSNGYVQYLGDPLTLTKLTFSGPGVANLDWFIIRTPFYATQLDNVNFTRLSPP